MNSVTTGKTIGTGAVFPIYCAYCNHNLSDSNPITYLNNQPVCEMCLSTMNPQELENNKVNITFTGVI